MNERLLQNFDRLIGEDIEIIEIVGIGMRDKAEIYQLAARRLKKMRKRG